MGILWLTIGVVGGWSKGTCGTGEWGSGFSGFGDEDRLGDDCGVGVRMLIVGKVFISFDLSASVPTPVAVLEAHSLRVGA
jgi:hypothetical protein